jgi:hypothetical protein
VFVNDHAIEHLFRRWVFWINLPLAGIAIAVAIWLVPTKPIMGDIRGKLLRIDYVGSVLTIIGSILLLVLAHPRLAECYSRDLTDWPELVRMASISLGLFVSIESTTGEG